jgi:hypothetical protein
MGFNKWFLTFLEEKGTDMSECCEAGDGTLLQYGDVCSAILSAPAHEQAGIKKMLVMIDFKNGSVGHYIEHLAKALNSSHKIGI